MRISVIQCDVILSRNKVSFASCSMYRVSSHTGSPCERTAQVPFPHNATTLGRLGIRRAARRIGLCACVCLRVCWSRTRHTHRPMRKLLTAPQRQRTHLESAPYGSLCWRGVARTRGDVAPAVAYWTPRRGRVVAYCTLLYLQTTRTLQGKEVQECGW